MRKHKIFYFFYFIIIFVLCTCNDPVFYAIHQEIKPIEPRIKGVPANFVIHDGRMYVASGHTLFSYNKGDKPDRPYWNTETGPGEKNILQIASAGGNLYALCSTDQNNNGRTVIKQLGKDNITWTEVNGFDKYPKLQNIFAAGDILFILATTASTNLDRIYYTILYLINGQIKELKDVNSGEGLNDTGELNGAAYNANDNIYYLTAKSRGVYRIDDIDKGAKLINYQNAGGEDITVNFTGIISLEDSKNNILLISRNGEIYFVNNTIEKIENVSMGKLSTGALVIWRENDQPDSKRLLLAGRQDSLTFSSSFGYSYGYLELELDEDGIKSGANFTEPGRNSFSTLVDYERYQSTIGKYPVNHLFQAPPDIDSNMTLFASTQKNGVWSCRDRDRNSKKYWNAEGSNEPVYFEPND